MFLPERFELTLLATLQLMRLAEFKVNGCRTIQQWCKAETYRRVEELLFLMQSGTKPWPIAGPPAP